MLWNIISINHNRWTFGFPYFFVSQPHAIIVAVTEGPVREEQLLHDMCLLGAMTVEITQILTRAGSKYVWTPLRQNPVLSCDEV
jgi:hypothetical protein